MLAVGIDWAEEFHLVALGRPDKGVLQVIRVQHTPTAVAALMARTAGLPPDPAEVRMVLETRHGMLVERLVEAGDTVLPVTPDLIARDDDHAARDQRRLLNRLRQDLVATFPAALQLAADDLPRLGNRWLEILWHCLMRGQLDDEAIHIADRNRALGRAA